VGLFLENRALMAGNKTLIDKNKGYTKVYRDL